MESYFSHEPRWRGSFGWVVAERRGREFVKEIVSRVVPFVCSSAKKGGTLSSPLVTFRRCKGRKREEWGGKQREDKWL